MFLHAFNFFSPMEGLDDAAFLLELHAIVLICTIAFSSRIESPAMPNSSGYMKSVKGLRCTKRCIHRHLGIHHVIMNKAHQIESEQENKTAMV